MKPDRKPRRCQATARAGKPCSALAVDGRLCAWHSTAPEWVEKRRAWSAKGGASRSNKARAAKTMDGALTPPQVAAVLSQTMIDLGGGAVEPGVANALVNVARVLVGMYGEWSEDYLTGRQDVVDQDDIGRDLERAATKFGMSPRELFGLAVYEAVQRELTAGDYGEYDPDDEEIDDGQAADDEERRRVG